MAERRLTDAPLHVQPRLLDTPLASPARRVAALALDSALLVVPTVLAALLVATASVYVRDRAAFDAGWTLLTGRAATVATRAVAVRALLPLLVRIEPQGLPREAERLIEEGRVDEAMALLADHDFTFALSFSASDEHQRLPPKTVRVRIEKLIPGSARGLALFFVPALYFTLLTSGRRGATIGKRLAGIRVVRLDGHRISRLEALERFIAYLELPGTLFIGLADLWRDPNRRMAHDRVAHTAVVRNAGTSVPEALALEPSVP